MSFVEWFDLVMDFWMSIVFPCTVLYLMLIIIKSIQIKDESLVAIARLQDYVNEQLKDKDGK